MDPPVEKYSDVDAILSIVGECAEVDRFYVFQYENDSMSITNEWCEKGIQSFQQNFTKINIMDFPWYFL